MPCRFTESLPVKPRKRIVLAGGSGTCLHHITFVHAIQSRQGLMVACLEEIGFHQGWLSKEDLAKRAASLGKSSYGTYLRQLGVVPLH